MSLKNLLSNKLRSFLTMLGIIVGISSVITLISIVQSSTNVITDQVKDLGANLITVSVTGRGTATSLNYEEVEAWEHRPGIGKVSPVISGSVEVKEELVKETMAIEGVTPKYEEVQNFRIQKGRNIMPVDVDTRQKIVVIGTEIAQKYFKKEEAIGKEIYLNGLPFTVVGLLEEKSQSLLGSYNEKILMPITTAERILYSDGIKLINIQANSPDEVSLAISTIEKVLNAKFNNDKSSYQVLNQQELLQTMDTVTKTMSFLLAGIAGISLLVGGIGIMNIMLVSVAERTREIGIRKAIGAKRKDILRLFLIESVMITTIGGIIGIIMGVAGSYGISNLMQVDPYVSPMVVFISLVFSMSIGVVFGILPANRAAKLKPIDALRVE